MLIKKQLRFFIIILCFMFFLLAFRTANVKNKMAYAQTSASWFSNGGNTQSCSVRCPTISQNSSCQDKCSIPTLTPATINKGMYYSTGSSSITPGLCAPTIPAGSTSYCCCETLPQLSTPTGLESTCSFDSNNKVTLKWNPVANATSYQVKIKKGSVDITTIYDISLTPGSGGKIFTEYNLPTEEGYSWTLKAMKDGYISSEQTSNVTCVKGKLWSFILNTYCGEVKLTTKTYKYWFTGTPLSVSGELTGEARIENKPIPNATEIVNYSLKTQASEYATANLKLKSKASSNSLHSNNIQVDSNNILSWNNALPSDTYNINFYGYDKWCAPKCTAFTIESITGGNYENGYLSPLSTGLREFSGVAFNGQDSNVAPSTAGPIKFSLNRRTLLAPQETEIIRNPSEIKNIASLSTSEINSPQQYKLGVGIEGYYLNCNTDGTIQNAASDNYVGEGICDYSSSCAEKEIKVIDCAKCVNPSMTPAPSPACFDHTDWSRRPNSYYAQCMQNPTSCPNLDFLDTTTGITETGEILFCQVMCPCPGSPTDTPTPSADPSPDPSPSVCPTAPTTCALPYPTYPSPGADCSKRCQGDANCDGIINVIDYGIYYKTVTTAGDQDKRADFNSNSSVESCDLKILQDHYEIK